MTAMTEQLMTVKEVAAMLNLRADTVYDKWRRGELPGYRLGNTRTIRFRRADIDKWLEDSYQPVVCKQGA